MSFVIIYRTLCDTDTGRMVMFFLGRYFDSGLLCILKPKKQKSFKTLETQKS